MNAFAITPIENMVVDSTFEDGPWAGARGMRSNVKYDGTVTSDRYALPSWRSGSGLGDAYYDIKQASGKYTDFYLFDYYDDYALSNVAIVSYDPLIELYAIDSNGVIIGNILSDALLTEVGGEYFYGVTLSGGVGIAFRADSDVYITELSPAFNGGSYHDIIMNSLPIMGGIYDGSSIAVRYPGLVFHNAISVYTNTYGYMYALFPVFVNTASDGEFHIQYRFAENTGLLHEGSQYNFYFKVYNAFGGAMFYADDGAWHGGSISNGNFECSFTGKETSLSNVGFDLVTGYSDGPDAYCVVYKTSSSDDIGTIPPDDDEGGSGSPDYSSALSSIGSSLKDLGSKLSYGTTTIVNNITNQTTQITNTITNTVTNMTQQITQGLTDVKQGITDKLEGVQQGITDKLGQVQDGINDKLGEVQDEIVNGYDNSGINQDAAELDQSLQEYEEAEKTVLDQVNGSLNDFEFDSGFDEYTNTIKVFSDFIQDLYDSSGGFKVVINLSLMLSIAGIVIGVYRFRDGG